MPLCSARTRTSPAPGASAGSARIDARPGASIQQARDSADKTGGEYAGMLFSAPAGRERSQCQTMECDLKAMPSQTVLRRDAWREALPCLTLLLLLAAGVNLAAGLGPWFGVRALAVFGLGFALVLRALPAHAPHARFGAANRVTLARLALVALLAAGVGEPLTDAESLAWGAIAVATTAALWDAIDGPLARAQGLASEFGARFDMETDALLVLVLSLLVIHF